MSKIFIIMVPVLLLLAGACEKEDGKSRGERKSKGGWNREGEQILWLSDLSALCASRLQYSWSSHRPQRLASLMGTKTAFQTQTPRFVAFLGTLPLLFRSFDFLQNY